jgi:uncharacterized protein (TIGR02231 family)
MRIALGLLATVILISTSHAAQKIEEAGTVTAVTLYRGQALVTRVVPVVADAGAIRVTVTGLPEAVSGASLFVNAEKNMEVRAVRYHTKAIGEAPEEEVKLLDDQIAGLKKKQRENQTEQNILQRNHAYLEKLETFITPTASVEMSKGVLNAETLTMITTLIFDQRAALLRKLLSLSEATLELQQELNLAQRKRSELARSHSSTLRQAIVFLDKNDDADSQLTLSYLATRASWSPTYNVRGNGNLEDIIIEVGALVHQTTGEDWNEANLTLSTAGAQLVADGPSLAPLNLHLGPADAQIYGVSSFEKTLKAANQKLLSNKKSQRGAQERANQRGFQWAMNTAVQDLQQIELAANAEDLEVLRRSFDNKTSSLAASYEIDGKVSLASRHDKQMVRIAKLRLPATVFFEAIPLLTEEVYRYVELKNNSDISLLAGNANVYLDNEFVGSADVPLVARGQTVTIGFGTDPQLHVTREFLSRASKDQILGSKKEITYRYRLVLENYGDRNVPVRVLDRIPMGTDDMVVTLGPLKEPLNTDIHYARTQRPQGILRWDLQLSPNSARETARTVEYSFGLKFDAKLSILAGAQKTPDASQRLEFEQMLDQRMYTH